MKNLLLRIDAWLLKHVFQSIVDWTERKPEWWTENAILMWGVTELVSIALDSGFSKPSLCVLAALVVIFTAIAVVTCRVSLALIAEPPLWRYVALCAGPVYVVCDFISKRPSFSVDVVHNLAYVGTFYFAACSPPKPKERRSPKAVPQT